MVMTSERGEGRDYSYNYESCLSCKANIMQVSSVECSSDEICNKMSLLQLASKSEYKFGIGIIYSYCYMYIDEINGRCSWD